MMAVAIAKLGGSGVIYCSQPVEDEARMIREVKRFKAGFVVPEVLSPEDKILYAMERMRETGYSKFPVTDDGTSTGKLLGLLTDNDFDSELHSNTSVQERMRRIQELDVAYESEIAGDIKVANRRLREGHHSVLPIISKDDRLHSLVFRKDMEEHERNPLELLDEQKSYIAGAAINTHDYEKRVPAVISAGADYLVIDTSQGHSEFVARTMEYLKKEVPEIPVIGGNVATSDAFKFLVENGVDAVKVGMGSGSICITQEQIRVGRGQASAVRAVSEARDEYFKGRGVYIPVCSDGGVITAGDILVALSLGADYVMLGGYIAGTDESNGPADVIRREIDGKSIEVPVKHYWGEGSRRAKEWAGKRYDQTRFEEGFETTVPYTGSLRDRLLPALSQVRDGMRKSGSYNVEELHKNVILQVLSPLSITLSRTKPGSAV